MNIELITLMFDQAHVRDAVRCLSSIDDKDIEEIIEMLRKVHVKYMDRAQVLITQEEYHERA